MIFHGRKNILGGRSKELAGRAGRLGYREVGRGNPVIRNPFERHPIIPKNIVLGNPEEISSSFKTDHVGTWLFRLLSQVC